VSHRLKGQIIYKVVCTYVLYDSQPAVVLTANFIEAYHVLQPINNENKNRCQLLFDLHTYIHVSLPWKVYAVEQCSHLLIRSKKMDACNVE